MRKIVNFINENLRRFRIVNFLICIAMIFIPYVGYARNDKIIGFSFFTTTKFLISEGFVGKPLTAPIVSMSIIILSGLLCIFIKKKFALLTPFLVIVVTILVNVSNQYQPILFFGFYIALAIFILYLIYIVADIIFKSTTPIAELEKEIKKILLKYGIPSLILIFTLSLNITMLCSDVFKGTYTHTEENATTKIIFFDNTFTEVYNSTYYTQGFYYTEKRSYIDVNGTMINYTAIEMSRSSSLERLSVFALKDSDEQIFICGTAIFLQVLYGVLELISLVFLIPFAMPAKKQKDAKYIPYFKRSTKERLKHINDELMTIISTVEELQIQIIKNNDGNNIVAETKNLLSSKGSVLDRLDNFEQAMENIYPILNELQAKTKNQETDQSDNASTYDLKYIPLDEGSTKEWLKHFENEIEDINLVLQVIKNNVYTKKDQ